MTLETNPTTWHFDFSTPAIWEHMLTQIASATSSIELEQFNFYPDNIGQRFVASLIERARAGVTIRVLLDSMGSISLGRSEHLELMQQAGITVRFFNWIFPYSTGNKRTWYFRDHRRTLLIDRKTAMTGGVCIGDQMRGWRDTSVSVEGELVSQISAVFEVTWKKAEKRSLMGSKQGKTNLDGFTFIAQSPLPRQHHLYRSLIEGIRTATKTVYLTTPYFLPDHRLLRVLLTAKLRGVDVRLLIPQASDHPFVDRGSHTYFHKILSSGIRIFRYKSMIHAKTFTIDSEWAMIGSLNLDNISLRYNFESAIVAASSSFAGEIENQFLKDLNNASELTLDEWNKRSFVSKILETIVWSIRTFL